MVEIHALVQFFPALSNQILEVVLVSCVLGHRDANESTTSDKGTAGSSSPTPDHAWIRLCRDTCPGGPDDLAKTAIAYVKLSSLLLENHSCVYFTFYYFYHAIFILLGF